MRHIIFVTYEPNSVKPVCGSLGFASELSPPHRCKIVSMISFRYWNFCQYRTLAIWPGEIDKLYVIFDECPITLVQRRHWRCYLPHSYFDVHHNHALEVNLFCAYMISVWWLPWWHYHQPHAKYTTPFSATPRQSWVNYMKVNISIKDQVIIHFASLVPRLRCCCGVVRVVCTRTLPWRRCDGHVGWCLILLIYYLHLHNKNNNNQHYGEQITVNIKILLDNIIL